MPQSARKTRERHLAKLAARRAAERRHRRRQRLIAAGVGGFLVIALISGLGVVLLTGGNTKTTARPTPTPTPAPSAGGVACGANVPEAAAVDKPTFKKAPPLTIDKGKKYTATLETSCGTIELELFPKEAPLAVNSFVFLAKKHFYDGLIFHRVVPNFVIQGGDPQGTGKGGPGYSFKDELRNDLKYELGSLAMANSGPDTNGSQFFIVAGSDGTSLPKNYTIFGKVKNGMSIVQRIDGLQTTGPSDAEHPDQPLQTVLIESVTIKAS
jgi:cyclophilin family peptidyl-prolyl cis-trans isomerase